MSNKQMLVYMRTQARFMRRASSRLHITMIEWVQMYAREFRMLWNKKHLIRRYV
jgi:hypothetical protein